MCGIVGMFNVSDSGDKQKVLLTKMLSTIVHRGPDCWGTFQAPKVSLGHVRLSIIDLECGNQPMESERYILSFNGEVYNYIELREELLKKDIQFTTNSDTEVVLRAFEEYGTDSFARLNGQFALLIWDKYKKCLISCRDRYGIRPLYVLNHNGGYYFSSEMKAFDVLPGYSRNYDMQNLFEHALLWNTLGKSSVYENIHNVSPGTYEIYEEGREPVSHQYYVLGESVGKESMSYSQAREEFSDLLYDSIKLRLRSDVPVGVYLSGGIDSSVIAYLTSKLNTQTFKTFSIMFEDKNYDESSYQKEMAELISSDHSSIKINHGLIRDNILKAVYHTERPLFRTAPVPLYLLSEKVNNSKIKVVLTGEGADEILFGYDSFKELKMLNLWQKNTQSSIIPLLIKSLYPHLQHYSDSKSYNLLKMYYENFIDSHDNELAGLNIRVHNNKIISNFFNKDCKLSLNLDALLEKIRGNIPASFSTWSNLQKNQFMEMKTLLSGYLLSSQGDRMSMSHSVEGRYPFLDHRLIEKLFSYPDIYKLKGFKQKHLLCDVFKDKIPNSIINRPKLPYQAPDLKSFMNNGELHDDIADIMSSENVKAKGIFETKQVTRFLNKFKKRNNEMIGYRDNMLLTFMISSHLALDCAKNPIVNKLDEKNKKVEIHNL